MWAAMCWRAMEYDPLLLSSIQGGFDSSPWTLGRSRAELPIRLSVSSVRAGMLLAGATA